MRPGERFAKLRQKYNLSQDEVCEKAGITQKHLSGIEVGAVDPPISTMEGLVRAIGSTMAEYYESKIPKKFPEQSHADLHEQLQDVLESGDASLSNQGDTPLAIQVADAVKRYHEVLTLRLKLRRNTRRQARK